ncbi:unnamed protein product [Microthlaspi erraticum]|uniref:Cytochrome P450 n=1 Tax=Microthlaspi erraticum TaxID=1685480 RepID=A0A6D2L8H9_9BRAS|nr:unnamed protein product [Microthlaspi erraticum]
MEISVASLTVSIAIAAVSWWVWRTLNWVWFKPKMLESYLRRQGLAGPPYTPLVGDLKKIFNMLTEARSKPIKLTDDIQPRVVPYPLQMLKTHGRTFFTWLGPIPAITIMDPEQIKEVFNKISDFPKTHTFPLIRYIATGLVSYDGDKWAKHRRIINPAFHLEKIKIMVPAFHQSCSEVVGEWDNYKEGQKIFELQTELTELITQSFRKSFIPGYRYLPTKDNRRMKAAAREIQSASCSISPGKRQLQYFCLDNGSVKPTPRLASSAREEVKQVFGDREPDTEASKPAQSYLDPSQMTMILYEVLRLYPPVTQLSRAIHKEMKLGDLTLPAAFSQSTYYVSPTRHELWGTMQRSSSRRGSKTVSQRQQRAKSLSFPLRGDQGSALAELCYVGG